MRGSTTTQLPIVVGIDGSQAAIQAAEWAVDEAVSREVPLRLVEVITQQAEPAPLASVGNVRMEVEYAQAALRIAAAAVAADGKLVKVETAILQGDPAAVLLAESCSASAHHLAVHVRSVVFRLVAQQDRAAREGAVLQQSQRDP
jgi:nucleotide-binding universal stress UspA family protein